MQASQSAHDICEYAGHEWGDAGGGLLVCVVCQAEKWAGDRAVGALHPEWSGVFETSYKDHR